MSDDLMKKMLRAVLQANKNGVSITRLQGEYRSLTGEFIPDRKLGYPSLECFLRSIPSVVRMENRMGEIMCFAAVCQETAHIAQLVARQKSSKRAPGRSQMLNCRMRSKLASNFVFYEKPRTSLRQPDRAPVRSGWSQPYSSMGPSRPRSYNICGGFSAGGDIRKMYSQHDERANPPAPAPQTLSITISNVPRPTPKALQPGDYNPQVVQNRISEVLKKYCSGLWLSKLPSVYRDMHKQDLPGQAVIDMENWTHICLVEKPVSTNRADRLVYPPQSKPPSLALSPVKPPTAPYTVKPATLKELLSKYSHGLWAHALPKLYQETFKVPFPEDILSNLSLLLDICTVEYPMADNKMKAILYGPTTEYKAKVGLPVPLQKCYLIYSSFIQEIIYRSHFRFLEYIGEGYSQALETMEESMSTVYSQLSAQRLLPFPSAGELAAVKVEGGEEVVRAQVCEVMTDKVTVYYVDHGFSEVLSRTKLLELQKDFLKLPFQATTCTLAGLEQFSSELSVLQTLESLAVGKILLVELLQHDADPPQVVLYDTSHDDEVNINVVCLKALQDKAMENPLQVNSTYMNVSVTNVCSDGTIFCQLPSRGRVNWDSYTILFSFFGGGNCCYTQPNNVTSESLVSTPFCGKCCLARYKGRWSRVEITNLHGSRVLDIKFVDLGVPASVEVIELREIPPSFLHELMVIPPQAIKCCLVELEVGVWTPEAVLWLRGAVLNSMDCSMKISRLDEDKLVHIYLFTSKGSQDVTNSVNHQMATSDLWKQPGPQKDGLPTLSFLDSVVANMVDQLTLDSPACSPIPVSTNTPSPLDGAGDMSNPTLVTSGWGEKQLVLPPLLELPQAGQNMDVYVSVACHPGHFVLQPWQDLYKLVVLMGEMVLYYNQREETPGPGDVQKGEVYAAKVDHNWHRVLVNRVLSSGLVSVYELDYGKHELVSCTLLQPLIESFRQLPFQGITAQLAGVEQCVWSEAASIVFRNHIEKKPLVAQVECVVEAELPWDRKMIVYLVDTSREETDIWVHNIMADFPEEQSTAA
uniref:Tudor domain containing 7 a n=1 Tax=Oncorhynchus mykiss TaxID=8022 RepID=A0A8C7VS11_ONCMY